MRVLVPWRVTACQSRNYLSELISYCFMNNVITILTNICNDILCYSVLNLSSFLSFLLLLLIS